MAVEFSKVRVGGSEREREKLDRSKWNAKVTSKFAAVGSGGSARQHALWGSGPLLMHQRLHLEEKLSDWLDLQKEREEQGWRANRFGIWKEKQPFRHSGECARLCVCVCVCLCGPNVPI